MYSQTYLLLLNKLQAKGNFRWKRKLRHTLSHFLFYLLFSEKQRKGSDGCLMPVKAVETKWLICREIQENLLKPKIDQKPPNSLSCRMFFCLPKRVPNVESLGTLLRRQVQFYWFSIQTHPISDLNRMDGFLYSVITWLDWSHRLQWC